MTASNDRDGRKAMAELAQILRRNPNDVSAWLDLALIVEESGRKRECYERALLIDPGNVEARSRLGALDIPEAGAAKAPVPVLPEETPWGEPVIEAVPVPEDVPPAAPPPKPHSPDLSLFLILAIFGCVIVVVPLAVVAYSKVSELGIGVPQPYINLPTGQPIPRITLPPGFSEMIVERPALAHAGKNGYDWRKASLSQKTAFCEWMIEDTFFGLDIETAELRQRLDRYYATGKTSVFQTEVTSAAVSVSLFDEFD